MARLPVFVLVLALVHVVVGQRERPVKVSSGDHKGKGGHVKDHVATNSNAKSVSMPSLSCSADDDCKQSGVDVKLTKCCYNPEEKSGVCCTPGKKDLVDGLYDHLTGSCRSSAMNIVAKCIEAITLCSKDLKKCKEALKTCATEQCHNAGKNELTCNVSSHLLFEKKPLIQKPCVPKSCVQTKQIEAFTSSLHSVICKLLEKTTNTKFCPISFMEMKCPGASSHCRKAGKVCSTSYGKEASKGGQKTRHPFTKISESSNPCIDTFTNITHKCPAESGGDSTLKECCNVGGRFISCCRRDVEGLFGDLFSGFSRKCLKDLSGMKKGCFRNLTSCLDRVQNMIMKPSLSITDLAKLPECLLFSNCQKHGDRCGAKSMKCTAEFNVGDLPANILPGTTIGDICLPSSCAASAEQLSMLSSTMFSAACFPACAVASQLKRSPFSETLKGLSPAIERSLEENTCVFSSTSITCQNVAKPGAPSSQTHGVHEAGDEVCPAYTDVSLPFGDDDDEWLDDYDLYYSDIDVIPGRVHKKHTTSSSSTRLMLISIAAGTGGLVIIFFVVLAVLRARQRRHANQMMVYSALDDDNGN